MFTYPHLLDNNSNAFDDDERSDWIINEEGVVDIGGLISLGDDISTFDDVKVCEAQASNAPMEWVMDQLKETMWNVMKECTEGGVALCVHVTSILKVVCTNVHTNYLIKAYESLHLRTIFNPLLSNKGKIGMNTWLHTNLLLPQELLMFNDIACMHFNAL
jgi:hypothetical protein